MIQTMMENNLSKVNRLARTNTISAGNREQDSRSGATKSGYKDTYYNLVSPENIEAIKVIIKNEGYYDSQTINKIQYNELYGLPYLHVTVDSGDYTAGRYALLDGIYLEITSIIPQWHGKFYLGIIILRKPKNEKIKQFINPANDLEHELHHLNFLIHHIDKHTDYIERSMKYNAGSCEIQDLDKSVEFEVNKIFLVEVPALISDFNMGEKDLLSYSRDTGIVTKITVDNKNDFLRYKVGEYLIALNSYYVKRFPKNAKQIKHTIEMEVDKQGESFFGTNCMALLLISMIECLSLFQVKGTRYEIGNV